MVWTGEIWQGGRAHNHSLTLVIQASIYKSQGENQRSEGCGQGLEVSALDQADT